VHSSPAGDDESLARATGLVSRLVESHRAVTCARPRARVRDEVLSVEAFDSVLEAQTLINDWTNTYNHQRPHSSLGWRPPAAYAATVIERGKQRQPQLS
jgi:transposase InsO family protein